MTGYISGNNIHCELPIQTQLLHTTNDICEHNKYSDYYSLFIESCNILKGELYNRQYTFTLYISKEIIIDQIIIPVFDKSYDIYIDIFDINQNNLSFVINTDNKITIHNFYKLTTTFSCSKMNPKVFCNIRGYINDYINVGCNINDFILEIIIE